MKDRHKHAYMKIAEEFALLSRCVRRQVGCVIVQDGILFPGYNGTPSGWNNTCETLDGHSTLPEVIHAERNSLFKITRSTLSSVGSSVFITTAPCMECAKSLLGAQVKEVFYRDIYRSEDGLNFLYKSGIHVEKIDR